jgi:hypothetical protein
VMFPPAEGLCSSNLALGNREAEVCWIPAVDTSPDKVGLRESLGLLSCMVSVYQRQSDRITPRTRTSCTQPPPVESKAESRSTGPALEGARLAVVPWGLDVGV